MSVDSSGLEGNGLSWFPALSADGRHAAFASFAGNLVPGDTNGYPDIFVNDRPGGQVTRVSVDSTGIQANSDCRSPSISGDGRCVAFESGAYNLVPGDTNVARDVFVHDRQSGVTTRVSVDSAGLQGNSSSIRPAISADGRVVAFQSSATNFVPQDTNGVGDVFVHDRLTGQTTRGSVSSAGVQGNQLSFSPALSADGRYVAFGSHASNLVPGDSNAATDVFVHDRLTAQTTRVSVDSAGAQGFGASGWGHSISADGRYVAFGSAATNLVPGDTNLYEDVFVHDRQTGATERVSVSNLFGGEADFESYSPSISADGRHVAFESFATNLVPGDTNWLVDIFVRDRQAGTTRRLSVGYAGAEANGDSNLPTISADGCHVVFYSAATNLVPGDTNVIRDVFLYDECPAPAIYCTAKPNSLGCLPAIASTGCSSAAASAGFQVAATPVLNHRPGLLLYGASGRAALPFQGGTLCVNAPVRRAIGVSSGGTPAPANDCTGLYALDMNAFASGALGGHPLPALAVQGTVVDCQWWGRDPGFPAPSNTSLSDALEYVVGP